MTAYTTNEIDGALRQAEIITDLVQFTYDPVSGDAIETPHEYAIVLSQDCDLLRDYVRREGGDFTVLNGVLVFELEPAEIGLGNLPGSDIRRHVKRHGEERYHRLDAVPPENDLLGKGLPELLMDFRKFFTMPPGEIYRQCADEEANRRCRLESPYREHVQTRAGFYLQRVALPD